MFSYISTLRYLGKISVYFRKIDTNVFNRFLAPKSPQKPNEKRAENLNQKRFKVRNSSKICFKNNFSRFSCYLFPQSQDTVTYSQSSILQSFLPQFFLP